MKILIPAIGSRGDVQPFVALAQGLMRAGHKATLASHPIMRELTESFGVPFAPIGPDIDLAKEVAAIRGRSRSAAIALIRAMRFGLNMVEQSHDDIMALCKPEGGYKVDMLVVSAQSAAGKNEADKLKLPYVSVTLMPWAITWSDPKRPLLRRMAYGAMDGLVGLITTRPLNRIRKRQGLPPVGKEGFTSKQLNLIPVSPAVFQANPYWESRHRLVGYWFVDELSAWEPPADLRSFLEDGEPPLVVSLGAMGLDGGQPGTAQLFVSAIELAGHRAIIQGWEKILNESSLPPIIFAAGSLPHGWLLPRCAGIVHHGGFGTTAASLRAGIPALIIPHVIDQFYWGQRVHELGAGPKPISRSKLDVEGLAEALTELISNGSLRDTASRLGEQIRSEHGVDEAVSLIEKVFGQ